MRKQNFKRPRNTEVEEDEEEDDNCLEIHGSHVYFYTDVTKKNIVLMFKYLNQAAQHAYSHNETVHLHIHSDGGCAYAGMNAMNFIKKSKFKIITIAEGFVASAATLLLLGGHERYCVPYTHILIHQLKTGFWGKFEDLKDEFKNSTLIMNDLKTIYKTSTEIPESIIDDLLKNEACLTATQCVEYKIVHYLL